MILALLVAAVLPVKGHVQVELRSFAAAIEVLAGEDGRVTVSVTDQPGLRVKLLQAGDRVVAEFDGRHQLREGKVRVEVPRGSALDLSTVSGPVLVRSTGGEVRVRGMSGPVIVQDAARVDVETIDGAVHIEGTPGPLRVHTISGGVGIVGATPALQVEIETSSGEVDVRGACGRGCRLDIDGVASAIKLALDAASTFSLRFVSHSGQLRDGLHLGVRRAKGDEGEWIEAVQGQDPQGAIECETFSGDLIVSALQR